MELFSKKLVFISNLICLIHHLSSKKDLFYAYYLNLWTI